MAQIGIEYIEHFAAARAAGVIMDGGQDVSNGSDVAEGLRSALESKGHTTRFHWIETDVFEIDMRDQSLGGVDQDVADGVDLFFICTHGGYNNGEAILLYDRKVDEWIGHSSKWRFGDACGLEWLLIYGCHTINSENIAEHLHLFNGLHLFCGAYDVMHDCWTIDDAGEDTGNNLTSGDDVADAWCDGVSDWWVDNHPMVISVETAATYNGGNVDWANTMIGSDHLWGHGTTHADIKPGDIYWMGSIWSEG